MTDKGLRHCEIPINIAIITGDPGSGPGMNVILSELATEESLESITEFLRNTQDDRINLTPNFPLPETTVPFTFNALLHLCIT